MAKNQFKKEEVKTGDKPRKKAKKVKSSEANFLTKTAAFFTEIYNNEKLAKTIGLVLLVFSVFLLLAFSSFLFTWKVDQNIIDNQWNNPDVHVENWLGKLGAYISHQFIFNGFGLAAFLIPFLSFIVGFRVLFKANILPLGKSFKYAVFSLVWLSVAFGYGFHSYPMLGGAYGFQSNVWLISIIGNVGVGLVLALSVLLFLVFNFNINFNLFPKKEERFNDGVENEDVELSPFMGNHIKETEEENTFSKEEKIEEDGEGTEEKEEIPFLTPLEIVEEPFDVKEKEEESSVELSTTIPEKGIVEQDVSFEVEEAKSDTEILSDSEVNKKAEDFGEYDPTLDLSSYQLPPIDLLKDFGDTQKKVTPEELEANKNKILSTLENYNIKITSIKATIGPTVTLYEIVPAPGVRISKIKNLEDDIALSLAALGIRIIAPIPGKGTVGIEVPNQDPEIVSMKTVVASDKFQNAKMELPVVMGKTITNETFIFDLAKMPHLLMAGATGQGKSVGLNAVLVSLLYKKHPSQLKFVLVDPKKVELTLYNKIERHYLAKLPDSEEAIITDNDKVINTLNSLCIEMDQRYELLKTAMVRNIVEYNAKFVARKLNPENGHKFLPYIVLVIDEFADLIMTAGKEVETPIARLAQLARAIGIHLIIATQRPSANIITGIIKANFPGRLAFRVTSGIDSRTILDSSGADQLIGRGDMLISQGNDLIRVQCAFVDTPEVEAICDFIGEQRGYPETFTLPEYVGESATGGSGTFDGEDRDALFDDAARMLVQHQQGSASLLQRKMKIGYNRAGRLIDQMEEAGIIGPSEGSKARQVLISDLQTLEQLLKALPQ
jgi:S-DNA-T family DNA segregation ATPase FtsK/SpoIIIE